MNKMYNLLVSSNGEIRIPQQILDEMGNPDEVELSEENTYFVLSPIMPKKTKNLAESMVK
jgi:hypothetical protein